MMGGAADKYPRLVYWLRVVSTALPIVAFVSAIAVGLAGQVFVNKLELREAIDRAVRAIDALNEERMSGIAKRIDAMDKARAEESAQRQATIDRIYRLIIDEQRRR